MDTDAHRWENPGIITDQPAEQQIKEIGEALAAGRKIEAIKIYRSTFIRLRGEAPPQKNTELFLAENGRHV